jgi:hypothetical protein
MFQIQDDRALQRFQISFEALEARSSLRASRLQAQINAGKTVIELKPTCDQPCSYDVNLKAS